MIHQHLTIWHCNCRCVCWQGLLEDAVFIYLKSLLAFCFLIFCISIFVLTLLALTLGLKAKRWSHFLLLHLPIPASCKMLVMPVDLRMNSGSKPPQQSRSWMSKQNSSRPHLYALLVDLSVWPNQDLHVVVTQQANDMNCWIELLFPSNRRVAPLWYGDNRDFLFLFMIHLRVFSSDKREVVGMPFSYSSLVSFMLRAFS